MTWMPFDSGLSIGTVGSESGVIIDDFEHESGARITIERDGSTAPFSITCGIYGWFCHTRFFATLEEAQSECTAMRLVLEDILHSIPLTSDPSGDAKRVEVTEAISNFVDAFP